jgi:fucose permease
MRVCPLSRKYFIISYAVISEPAKLPGRKVSLNKTIFLGFFVFIVVLISSIEI